MQVHLQVTEQQMEKVSGGKILKKCFGVVGDFTSLELSLPWSYGGRAAGCSPCSSTRVCVNLLGALAIQKVFTLITEVVLDRTGLTVQAGPQPQWDRWT